MAVKITAAFALIAVVALLANFRDGQCSPAIATSYDDMRNMEVCIENCAQCKKMLGPWFEGPLCAESCIKNKGQIIPECEDIATISRFLNKL